MNYQAYGQDSFEANGDLCVTFPWSSSRSPVWPWNGSLGARDANLDAVLIIFIFSCMVFQTVICEWLMPIKQERVAHNETAAINLR